MLNIPYITEEELKKFKELLAEQKKREEEDKKTKSQQIKDLIGKFEKFKVDYANYGTVEALANKFASYLKDYFSATNEEFIPFNWLEMQMYLTERCLRKNKKDQIDLKRSFRDNLRDYGFCILINRKYNTMRIKPCEPRKRKV